MAATNGCLPGNIKQHMKIVTLRALRHGLSMSWRRRWMTSEFHRTSLLR